MSRETPRRLLARRSTDRLARAATPALQPIPAALHLAAGLLLSAGVLGTAQAQTASAPATSDAVLPTVTVKAKRLRAEDLPPVQAGGLSGSGARLGLLGNLDVMDTPFSITSYTAQLIEDQQAKTVADVLNNDPSVRFTTSGAHAYENLRLRGFDVHSSNLAINGMFGLAPLGTSTLEFVERVEVLKGPSAMFTGMAPTGDIGGIVNLVPKRAADTPITRVTLNAQTENQLGTHLDLGRRFGEDKAIGLRVNAAYSEGDTALKGQSKERHMVAAALDYRSSALTASLDVYDSQLNFEGGSAAMYGFATTTIPKAPDPSTNFLKGASGELKSQGVFARADYSLGNDASVFAGLGTRTHDYSGFVNGTHAHSVQANGSALVRGVAQLGFDDSQSAELGARLRLDTGSLRHEFVLQATHLSLEAGVLSNVTGMQASNIYNPITPTLPALPTGTVPKTSDTTLSSLALVDTIALMKDAATLTLGLREQRVEQKAYSTAGAVTADYDQKALTPAVGIVLKPWGPAISVYANYVQGLSKGDTVSDLSATNYGQVFKPYKTEQKEVGLKWLTGSFLNTAALFQIDKPTMMSTGASSAPTYTDGAETRVRGLEWSTSGELLPTLRLIGGASYTKGTLTKTQGGTNQGKEVYGVPHWQGNIGAQWDTPLSGLGLNARVIATSSQFLDSANTYRIPGWGQLDLGTSYATRLIDRKLVLRLNVDNVLDRHYYSGGFAEPRATLAQGRIVRASATMDF